MLTKKTVASSGDCQGARVCVQSQHSQNIHPDVLILFFRVPNFFNIFKAFWTFKHLRSSGFNIQKSSQLLNGISFSTARDKLLKKPYGSHT